MRARALLSFSFGSDTLRGWMRDARAGLFFRCCDAALRSDMVIGSAGI